jgi:glycosyltransferase involved in cell wall biosynthesis
MRIAQALGWYLPDSVGGTEIYVAGLTRRLRAAGHEVAIVVPDTVGERTGEHDGVPVYRYPVPAHATRDEAYGRVAVRGAERLTEWLQRWRPDVFHMHSFVTGLGLFELEAARRAGARTVVTHHLPSLGYVCRTGTLMQWGELPCDGICEPEKCAACRLFVGGLPKPAARAIAATPRRVARVIGRIPGRVGTTVGLAASIEENQVMQRTLVDLADRMVVLNDQARAILVANGVPASSITINRLGISERIERKPDAPTRSPVRFVFVGRLHRTKGIVELAQAVAQIPGEIRFTLAIHGPSPDPSERALVDGARRLLRDDRRVTFAGPIAPADVASVLASADVLLCPSTWFENGPTVAIEAIACGTPVLGTRLGNLAELIADGVNGRLVPPADVEALAGAMSEIAERPSLVDAWRAALPRARSMNEIAVEYLSLYDELARQRVVA